jgi:hypothetical protein
MSLSRTPNLAGVLIAGALRAASVILASAMNESSPYPPASIMSRCMIQVSYPINSIFFVTMTLPVD